MIPRILNNFLLSLLLSAAILGFHSLGVENKDWEFWTKLGSLFVMGVSLNMLCRRFRIIGVKSHLTMVVFAIFSVLLIPHLEVRTLVVGYFWLAVVFFAFNSWEQPENTRNNAIFMGIALGITQILESNAVFLVIPVFALFFQNSVSKVQYYVISVIYFIMVVFIYGSVLYFLDMNEAIPSLLPRLGTGLKILDEPIIGLVMSVLIVYLLIHLANLSSYKFRYPNRSININLIFLYQILYNSALVLFSEGVGLIVLIGLPISVLLSVGFSFKKDSLVANAAFMALLVWTLLLSGFINLF